MPNRTNRRQFLQTTAMTGVGFWVAGNLHAEESKSPNEKVRMAAIGIGGTGSSDSGDAGAAGQMVAICDVDESRLNAAAKRFPGAKLYTDFRKMLEEMDKSIDAVTVSTPDHTHAAAALMAMRMGKHCFCQKPLTHTIYEARLMGQVAREKKVATQMGNQGTAMAGLRKGAAMLRAGVLGKVSEVHVWTNRPVWPQGGERAQPKAPPAHLKWEEWLGPAPERPYADGYHPFSWRGWWDFGTGALGDMACHTLNMPYMGLDLRDPISVQATTSGHNKDSYPKWSLITFEFAGNDKRPGLKFYWYDGGKKPGMPSKVFDREALFKGVLFTGDKGYLICDYDFRILMPTRGGDMTHYDSPKAEELIPPSPGHHKEWIIGCKTGKPTLCNFDYSGALVENNLLALVACRVGQKLEWDAQNLKATNCPEADKYIRTQYRPGWVLNG